jgi:hypothetical protein
MKQIAQVIAIPVLAAVAFLGFAYGSLYFAGFLFPRVVPRPYVEMLSAAAAGSAVAGLLVALPLVKLYPSRYRLAALLVASPLMLVRASDLAHYIGRNDPRILVMSVAEFFIYPALILLACGVVRRFYPRLRAVP